MVGRRRRRRSTSQLSGRAWDPTGAERPYVAAGGAAYVEMNLVDTAGQPLTGVLAITAPAIDDIAHTLVFYDPNGGPNNDGAPCASDPAPITLGGPGDPVDTVLGLSGDCTDAVLIFSHTGLTAGPTGDFAPGVLGNGVQVDWTAEVASGAVNLAFEAGDLSQWTPFATDPLLTGFEVRPDGAAGSTDPYAAHIILNDGTSGPAELGRTITAPFYNTIAIKVAGTTGAEVTFETITAFGTGTTTVTLTGAGNWHDLSLFTGHYIPTTIRIIGRGAPPPEQSTSPSTVLTCKPTHDQRSIHPELMRTSRHLRYRAMLIAATAAITLTGCDRGLSPLPCNCPNLTRATDAIEWAPTAQAQPVAEARSESGVLGRNLVFTGYEDRGAAQDRVDVITLALEESEFKIEVNNDGLITARDHELVLDVYATTDRDTGGGAAKLHVNVRYDGEDSPEIAELLAPVGHALETIDGP